MKTNFESKDDFILGKNGERFKQLFAELGLSGATFICYNKELSGRASFEIRLKREEVEVNNTWLSAAEYAFEHHSPIPGEFDYFCRAIMSDARIDEEYIEGLDLSFREGLAMLKACRDTRESLVELVGEEGFARLAELSDEIENEDY